MNYFFCLTLLVILLTSKVFANNYICDAWTNTLTLEKDKDTFTASIESGTLNLRSSNNLPNEIPKFSQLSISLPNYDLFLSPNGTIITATPLSDTSFLIYVFFPNIERRWFWFSKCRLIK
jgi:hypothetical protein